MLQFARYHDGNAHTAELISIIERNSISTTENIVRFKSAVCDWYSHLGDFARNEYGPRALAIVARLCYWGKSETAETLRQLMPMKRERQKVSHYLLVQDAAHCIGQTLADRLGIGGAHESSIRNSNSTGIGYDAFRGSESRYWIYQPRLSGFYSVLENIVCASILAKAHHKILLVDLEGDWWIYPLPFSEIFGNLFPCYQTFRKYADANQSEILPFELMRAMFSGMCEADPKYIYQKKKEMYSDFYLFMRRLSSINAKKLDEVGSQGVLYLRAGDKLVYEALSIPMDYYIKDLHEMKRHCSVVNVLSDDYGFAQRIIEQSGISNVNNLTESIFSGYYNSAANPSLERKDQATEDDIRAMINNYVLIASSGISGSCPSTNIVNCAHWSANFFLSPHLASVPIEKYLML